MPTLIKKHNNPVWFIRFRHRGQDRLRSTGETDRRRAGAHLKTAAAEARGERTWDVRIDEVLDHIHSLPAEQREALRLRIIARLDEVGERRLAVTDAWPAWLAVPKQTGASTRSGYEAIWIRFQRWLGDHRPTLEQLSQVSEHDARDYAENLWQSKVSAGTFNQHVNFLRRLWKQLRVRGGGGGNVWNGIERQERRVVSHDALKPDQLATVIQAAGGELRGLLLVGLLTSLRLKDAVHLSSAAYDSQSQTLRVTPFKTRRKNRVVTVPVHPQLVPLLSHPGAEGFYFPELLRRYQASRSSLSKLIQRHFEDCGLKTTECPDGVQRRRAAVKLGFHSLRFSFVSLCAAKGVPQHVLGELVGHSSPSMTLHYSRSDAEQRRTAVGQLPVIELEN